MEYIQAIQTNCLIFNIALKDIARKYKYTPSDDNSSLFMIDRY
jgi:hypothetical protein